MNSQQVVLVTGSTRGIGKQLALDCSAAGHRVVVNYRSDAANAENLIADITNANGAAIAIKADVSIEEEARMLISGTLAAFGGIDCVVNNAGIGVIRSLEEMDASAFWHTMNANLGSSFHVSQAAIPHMKSRGGRLVFMSSGAAMSGGKISAAYAASKAGIEGLMRYYAAYLERYRITSNAIAPSLIATDMVEQMDLPSEETMPLGRLGRADELWPIVRMFMETEYLNGQTVRVERRSLHDVSRSNVGPIATVAADGTYEVRGWHNAMPSRGAEAVRTIHLNIGFNSLAPDPPKAGSWMRSSAEAAAKHSAFRTLPLLNRVKSARR